jgi:hypothetical protein
MNSTSPRTAARLTALFASFALLTSACGSAIGCRCNAGHLFDVACGELACAQGKVLECVGNGALMSTGQSCDKAETLVATCEEGESLVIDEDNKQLCAPNCISDVDCRVGSSCVPATGSSSLARVCLTAEVILRIRSRDE